MFLYAVTKPVTEKSASLPGEVEVQVLIEHSESSQGIGDEEERLIHGEQEQH